MTQGNHTIQAILNIYGYYIQLPPISLTSCCWCNLSQTRVSHNKSTQRNKTKSFFVSKISSCRLQNLYITLFTIFTLLKLSKFTLTLKNTIDTPCSPYSKQNLARNFRVSQPQLCNLRNGIETLKPCIGWFLYDTSPH